RLKVDIVSSASTPARASVPHALSVGTAVGVGTVGGVGPPGRPAGGGSPVMVMMKRDMPMPLLGLTGVLVAGGKGSTLPEMPVPTKLTPGPILTAVGIASAGDIDTCGVWSLEPTRGSRYRR